MHNLVAFSSAGTLLLGAYDPTMSYTLQSFIGYSNHHYKSFHRLADDVNWVLSDGPALIHIGDWEAVQALCLAGLTQPTDVFFEADSASPAAHAAAPTQLPPTSAEPQSQQQAQAQQKKNTTKKWNKVKNFFLNSLKACICCNEKSLSVG